jgi:hypothetical protein
MRIDHGDMEESRGVARELGRARARALVSAPVVPDGDATGPPSVKPKPPGGPARE